MVELSRRSAAPEGTATAPMADGIVRDGASAGAISVVVFTLVHHLTISDIWSMLPMMLMAGAACGACITWTFQGLFQRRSLRLWAASNLMILAALAVLAAASIVIYEPVTTMAAIMDRGGPVDDLIMQALPLTALYIVVMTVTLGLAFGQERADYLRLLTTITVLTLLVGINVSVLGLVEFAGDSTLPVLEFFALIVMLDAVYAFAFAVLRRRWLTGQEPKPA